MTGLGEKRSWLPPVDSNIPPLLPALLIGYLFLKRSSKQKWNLPLYKP